MCLSQLHSEFQARQGCVEAAVSEKTCDKGAWAQASACVWSKGLPTLGSPFSLYGLWVELRFWLVYEARYILSCLWTSSVSF